MLFRSLETAGVLSYGRRVWGLARVNDGAEIIGGDVVRPYVLLGTSYDGTMATVAKFTSVRVVCHNTITAALGSGEAVRVLHSERFDADRVRQDLGIVAGAWDRFLIQSRQLAGQSLSTEEADQFVRALRINTFPIFLDKGCFMRFGVSLILSPNAGERANLNCSFHEAPVGAFLFSSLGCKTFRIVSPV